MGDYHFYHNYQNILIIKNLHNTFALNYHLRTLLKKKRYKNYNIIENKKLNAGTFFPKYIFHCKNNENQLTNYHEMLSFNVSYSINTFIVTLKKNKGLKTSK